MINLRSLGVVYRRCACAGLFVRYAVALSALFAASAAGARADNNTLTLDDAVSQALAKSPEIISAQAQADGTSWKKLEALSEHLPHLSLNANHYFTEKYLNLDVDFLGQTIVFPTGNPQDTVSVDASIMVFDGFSAINRYRAAALDTEAADLMLDHEKFRIGQEVRIRFQRALANQTLLGVADEDIKSLEDHLNQAQLLAKNGYSTRFDVLRVEAQLEEARAEKVVTEDNVAQARRDLAREIGVTELPPNLTGDLPVPNAHVVPSDLKLDPSARTDLAARDRHESAVDHLATAASTFWVPQVAFFGEFLYYRFGDFNPIILSTPWANSYNVGVKLSWNLFDGGASYARAREASANLKREEQTLRGANLDAFDEFDNWKRRFIYNTTLYEARTRTVEESQESVRLAAIGLKAGTRTSTERLDAELELFQARAGLVRAQADADEALLRLELALGHPLKI